MKFKSEREEAQFNELSVILKLIASDLEEIASFLGKDITITRVYDPVEGESGVHLDKRAFDVRNEFEGVKTFSDDEVGLLLEYINDNWPRNDGLQTMIHHKFQGGPWHLHVQIPLSTKTYEAKHKEGEVKCLT